jgi:glucuronate isomerase
MADLDQTMAVSRTIGFLEAERALLTYKPDHEATVAIIDSVLADLFTAFPTLQHLKEKS